MNLQIFSQQKGRIATSVVIVGMLLGIAWSALNQPGGPIEETTGVVQAVGGMPSTGEQGPSAQMATVRLGDGTLVQALVVDPAMARPGQVGKVRVYRRALSGSLAYELIAAKTK